MKKNIQILIETMTRCGGNCSGCAMGSSERMTKGGIDWDILRKKVNDANFYLNGFKPEEVESVSVFLGQGDHFLMSEKEIESFMQEISVLVPESLRHKSIILITASAIGKHEIIKGKMDFFYDLSLKHGMPFFIQVVFDPKKYILAKSFKDVYIKNILYFKEKCGITELTLNVGKDFVETMSPLEFHNWVVEHGFIHVEFNWVMNSQTVAMWRGFNDEMYEWILGLIRLSVESGKYEINFIQFLANFLKNKGNPSFVLNDFIENSLAENMYIDNYGNKIPSQCGMLSNLIPLGERLFNDLASVDAKKIALNFIRSKSCMTCDYVPVCSVSGVFGWKSALNEFGGCPLNIKSFLVKLEEIINRNPWLANTRFNKNPVQSSVLLKDNNETSDYFEKRFNADLNSLK